MDVSAITGAGPSAAVTPGHRIDRKAVDDAVAKELGISTDDLRSQLRSGKSLADLAADHGVSHDDLVSTIKGALGSNVPAGNADPIANRIADNKRHHHHHPAVDPSASAASTAATSAAPASTGAGSTGFDQRA